MKIGVQLPVAIPGVMGDRLLDRARQVYTSPLSSLGVVDRSSCEPRSLADEMTSSRRSSPIASTALTR